ncbi:nitrate/sulfonate/bicarbonate ABC transporter ATP-binding protein [Microbacteriaceae bacterium 4G12]
MKNCLIKVQDVTKLYEKEKSQNKIVLENISLDIREGEFVSILGPSGSGKSTLLRIIAGLVPSSKGIVQYNGTTIDGINPGCSMVFQSFALFPWLTVEENIELGLETFSLSTKEKKERVDNILQMIGLEGFENAYPKELSGGMRQRVGIGRALVMEPDILLMDEPFSALDVLTAENLKNDILDLWYEKKIPTKSIIMVTHSIEEAVYMSDRAIVLSRDPAHIIADISIMLDRPRDKEQKVFAGIVDHLYSLLTRREKPAAGKKNMKKWSKIPSTVSGEALAGFVELLRDLDEDKFDLYKLAGEELMLDLEDFLPLVEAADLLGLTVTGNGDIALTVTGKEFADSSLHEQKDLFRQQILERIPMMPTIVNVLQSKANKTMNREFFIQILNQHYHVEESENQLDAIIDWGRYADLFDYDEDAKQLFMEDTEFQN